MKFLTSVVKFVATFCMLPFFILGAVAAFAWIGLTVGFGWGDTKTESIYLRGDADYETSSRNQAESGS